MNLLTETLGALKKSNKIPAQVFWVGSSDGKLAITWDEFAAIADIEYDNGFGGQEIASDLVVVGSDWWLERYEYDGAESWAFKSRPIASYPSTGFARVYGNGTWLSLAECNAPGEE